MTGWPILLLLASIGAAVLVGFARTYRRTAGTDYGEDDYPAPIVEPGIVEGTVLPKEHTR